MAEAETSELRRSKSDESALTAGSDRVCFPNDNTKWTDEKHRAYLNHLEFSFVKELHHSINSLLKGKVQNQKNGSLCEMELSDAHCASQQFSGVRYGNRQMINPKGGNDFFHPTTDSRSTANKQEGSGQNFVDEVSRNDTNARS